MTNTEDIASVPLVSSTAPATSASSTKSNNVSSRITLTSTAWRYIIGFLAVFALCVSIYFGYVLLTNMKSTNEVLAYNKAEIDMLKINFSELKAKEMERNSQFLRTMEDLNKNILKDTASATLTLSRKSGISS